MKVMQDSALFKVTIVDRVSALYSSQSSFALEKYKHQCVDSEFICVYHAPVIRIFSTPAPSSRIESASKGSAHPVINR